MQDVVEIEVSRNYEQSRLFDCYYIFDDISGKSRRCARKEPGNTDVTLQMICWSEPGHLREQNVASGRKRKSGSSHFHARRFYASAREISRTSYPWMHATSFAARAAGRFLGCGTPHFEDLIMVNVVAAGSTNTLGYFYASAWPSNRYRCLQRRARVTRLVAALERSGVELQHD